MPLRPHILIVSTWYPSANDTSGTFVQMQAKALVKRGFKVTVLLPEYYTLRTFIKSFFSILSRNYKKDRKIKLLRLVIILPPSIFCKNPLLFQKKYILKYCFFRIKIHCLLYEKIDLIHHHGVLDNSYITQYISQKLSIPYIITEHTPFLNPNTKFHNPFDNFSSVKNFVQNASVRISPSVFYAKKFENLFNAPYIVIHNLVEDEFLNDNPINSASGPFVFLSIGYLEPIKNHELLIRAFSKAFPENKSNVVLNIVGTGSLRTKLENITRELNVERYVKFLGYANRQEIKKILDASNVLVVSSNMENSPTVIREAFLRGKPVISTKCGGPQELIDDTNGILCEVNDINSMANAMRQIYENYEKYDKEKIRKDAINKYSEEVVVKSLQKIYYDILDKKK
jgi:glycosyltransferase involved in cell wall biosynthesis